MGAFHGFHDGYEGAGMSGAYERGFGRGIPIGGMFGYDHGYKDYAPGGYFDDYDGGFDEGFDGYGRYDGGYGGYDGYNGAYGGRYNDGYGVVTAVVTAVVTVPMAEGLEATVFTRHLNKL